MTRMDVEFGIRDARPCDKPGGEYQPKTRILEVMASLTGRARSLMPGRHRVSLVSFPGIGVCFNEYLARTLRRGYVVALVDHKTVPTVIKPIVALYIDLLDKLCVKHRWRG